MIIYLATPTTILSYDKSITNGVYVLETYHAIRKKKDLDWIEPDKFILDSGAYTYMRGNGGDQSKTNWEKYIEEYAEFILTNKVKHFFELDIDKIVGYPRVKELTKRLNDLTGMRCLPVWHKSRGMNAWHEMIEENEYISLSASGNNGSSEWTRTPDGEKVLYKLNEMARKKNVRVHALGYTRLEQLKKIPFYSCDSTSWTFGVRSGGVHQFIDGKITRIEKPVGTKCNVPKVSVHSYNEWKKLQKYFILNH